MADIDVLVEVEPVEIQIEVAPDRTVAVVASPVELPVVVAANLGPRGTQGLTGTPGDTGPPGPPGPPGGASYTHTQTAPSDVWVVTHDLQRQPSITVVDSGESVVLPDVHYDSVNQATLTFGSPTSGKAYVN